MATLACFHAHPDDEAIATAGVLAKAKALGHRTIVVFATRGELGEVPDWLDPDETLGELRTREAETACALLGVDRVEWLGYRDSGVEDDDRNHDTDTFHSAPLDDAAAVLAAILRGEHVDVLTVYDENGNYGHPDHIKVHEVGYRAAELARTPLVYETTIDRDFVVASMRDSGVEFPEGVEIPDPEEMNLGMPAARITTEVDVSEFAATKRAAMAAHASQINETSFFLQIPEDRFGEMFGREWFIRRGGPLPPAARETDLFAPLADRHATARVGATEHE
jgi:LmbE family N-acetylglucosaminyl deacetylase